MALLEYETAAFLHFGAEKIGIQVINTDVVCTAIDLDAWAFSAKPVAEARLSTGVLIPRTETALAGEAVASV